MEYGAYTEKERTRNKERERKRHEWERDSRIEREKLCSRHFNYSRDKQMSPTKNQPHRHLQPKIHLDFITPFFLLLVSGGLKAMVLFGPFCACVWIEPKSWGWFGGSYAITVS